MSATYSTDSAGSSLSVDGDSENWSELDGFRKIILEENAEDYVQWGGEFENPTACILCLRQTRIHGLSIPSLAICCR